MRKIITAIFSIITAISMTTTSFAGAWVNDAAAWHYVDDNGAPLRSQWAWLKSAEGEYCYYFDANGNMLAGTTTPDGYTVDESGAWVQNGQRMQRSPQQTSVMPVAATAVRTRVTRYTPEQEAAMKAFWDRIAVRLDAGEKSVTETITIIGNMNSQMLSEYAQRRHFLGYSPMVNECVYINCGSYYKVTVQGTERTRRFLSTDRAVRAWVEAKLAGRTPGFETLRWFYEEVSKIPYAYGTEDTFMGAYPAVEGGAILCGGYANLMMYAAELMGLEAYNIRGEIVGVGQHGWNAVVYNGKVYTIDACWAGGKKNLDAYFVESADYFFHQDPSGRQRADIVVY